jgi:ribonuclease BN (tRNA processing enzyme)
VEADDCTVLVDCGSGVVSNLLTARPRPQLDAILISHQHPDHLVDLIALRYGALYGPGPKAARPTPLWVSPGLTEVLNGVARALVGEGADDFWTEVFDIAEYRPDETLSLGDLDVRFAPTTHYVDCWAMRFESGGETLVYTADTAPDARVEHLAEGADLLVAEATLLEREGNEAEWGHMSAAEAGGMAARAGVRKLVLTHYWQELGPERLVAAAAKTFGGETRVAREHETYGIS